MSESTVFSWHSNKVRNWVFLLGLAYFSITTGYSLIHYTEKFMLDGYSLIFNIVNSGWFTEAAQREILYLQQIIPVLFAIAGLKIKTVMIGYILNVYGLYFTCFLFILLVLKDPLFALLLILTQYKGDPYNYFIFVEELLPGMCKVIVFLSLFRNLSSLRYRKAAYLLGVFLLLIIVRSHPLAVLCLLAGMIVLFFVERNHFVEHKKTVIAIAIATALLLADKLLSLNSYDAGFVLRTANVKAYWHQLKPHSLTEIVFYLSYSRLIFNSIFVITFVYLFIKNKFTLISTVVLLAGFFVLLLHITVITTGFSGYPVDNPNLDRWSLPIRFIVFMVFCIEVLPEIKGPIAFKATGMAFTLYLILGFTRIAEVQVSSKAYVGQAQTIIDRCRKEGVQKAVILRSQLNDKILLHHNCYQDIMVISSLNSSDSTIQVVYVDDTTSHTLNELKKGEIVLGEGAEPCIYNEINVAYFNLPEEPYTFVNLKE